MIDEHEIRFAYLYDDVFNERFRLTLANDLKDLGIEASIVGRAYGWRVIFESEEDKNWYVLNCG